MEHSEISDKFLDFQMSLTLRVREIWSDNLIWFTVFQNLSKILRTFQESLGNLLLYAWARNWTEYVLPSLGISRNLCTFARDEITLLNMSSSFLESHENFQESPGISKNSWESLKNLLGVCSFTRGREIHLIDPSMFYRISRNL